MLNLVGLLNLNADTNGVDAGLDQDSLVVVAGDVERGEQDLR